MKTILKLYLFISFHNFIYASNYVCSDAEISEPPFYVSDEWKQGDKVYENLRNPKNPSKVDKYLPRDSIVKVDPELFDYSDDDSYRVPVQVLSVPDTSLEDSISGIKERVDPNGNPQKRRFKGMLSGINGLKRAGVKDLGFINKRSLRKLDGYSFILKEPAPVYKTMGNIDPATIALTFDSSNGKFKIKRCCLDDNEEKCYDKYKINTIDSEGKAIRSQYVNIEKCNFLEKLYPIENDKVLSILKVVKDLRGHDDFKDFTGIDLDLLPANNIWGKKVIEERPKMAKFPFDPKNGTGPYNSFHYSPDDYYNTDSYLHPTAQCAFMNALKKFSSKCDSSNPGCLVQIGDMYHHDNWGAHVGHDSGFCIDIRPMRNDKTSNFSEPTTYKAGIYSRERTEDLIESLMDSGATLLYFNDSKIKTSGIRRDSDGLHDNHIHVCFNPNDKNVASACNGLN